MPARTTLTPPVQSLPDTPAPQKTWPSDAGPNHLPTTPSRQLQLTTDDDEDDANSIMSQCGEAEDAYTLSAYGDISLSEVQAPSLPEPAHLGSNPLQQRVPRPRLRLRVQRPPMPKHRMSFSYYVPDPFPYTGGIERDERWPGSPRPTTQDSHRLQPLVSPVSPLFLNYASSPSETQGNQSVKNNSSSFDNFFEELLPSSPSIRLSPPGSPANVARSLPQETTERKSGSRHARNPSERDDAKKVPQSPAPAPRDKPKPAPWRTRLPPRLPIPKWDL